MRVALARRHPVAGWQTFCAAALLLAGFAGRSAEAQQRPDTQGPSSQTSAAQIVSPVPQAAPPYRGLFGAGSSAEIGGHLLDLTTQVYGEYGNNEESAFPSASDVLETGWFLGVRSALSFEKAGRNTQFGLRGEGAFRYYRDTQQTTLPRLRVELGVESRTGQRKQDRLTFGGAVEYEPYYILPIIPTTASEIGGTAILPTSRDDLLFRRERYIYKQSFSFEHQLSQRSFVRVSDELRYTRASTRALDVETIRAGASYGYRTSRYTALRLGYGYQTGRYGLETAERIQTHDIDLGFEFRKPLTRSRRTSLAFGAGSSQVVTSAQRYWTAIGAASLRHELSAGWFIEASFGRNVQLVEGFADPFFVNTATARVGGFLGRRLELLASGGYSAGVIGFGTDNYSVVQGVARLRLALARFLAIDTEGLINQHTFDNRTAIPGSLPGSLNRWAVRCNVALWLPLSR